MPVTLQVVNQLLIGPPGLSPASSNQSEAALYSDGIDSSLVWMTGEAERMLSTRLYTSSTSLAYVLRMLYNIGTCAEPPKYT